MKVLTERFLSAFKFTSLFSLQVFQLIRYGSFILIGIGLAKLQLPTEDIGYYETLLLVSGMVSFFWVSGIINTMLSIYPRAGEGDKQALLFNTFITLCGLSLITGGLILVFENNLLAFTDKTGAGSIIRLAALYLLVNCPSFISEYILFLNDKKQGILYYGIASGLLTLAAGMLPVALSGQIEYAVYGLIAAATLRFVFAGILLAKYGSFSLNAGMLLQGLKLSIPLMLSIFVSGSAEYIDGLIVKGYFPDSAFAVYRYGAKELPILLIIANTFSTAMIPAIAANLDAGLAALKQRSTRLMHIFFPLTIVLMLVSPFLYPLLFNPNFAYSALIFNFYLLLTIPRMVFPQTVLTGLQKTNLILLSSCLEIVINVSLSLYFAQKLGLYGIALGTFIAYSFDKLFLITVNAFVLKISPGRYMAIWPFMAYTLLTLVAFVAGYALLTGDL